ncbi:MAG: glycine zipper 2TM domain-containing protein [Burkholderiales bacterium]|nr:glycine zipper 2TM domain-containing protein [Burkholderiales bacterium]
MMNLKKSVIALSTLALLSGCANMTTREKNMAIGATVGGVLGSVLSNGNGAATAGGAAVGGYIGHEIKH